jgi:hypothetical protein
MDRLNDYALDRYLRGVEGEEMRREAQQELYRRGRRSTSIEEMIARLEVAGYAVLSPERLAVSADMCPWCGRRV